MAYPLYPYVPQSASAVAIEVQRLDAAHVMRRMRPHGHTFFELLVVTNGSGRYTVGNAVFEARPGTAFVIPPGAIHDCRDLDRAEAWALLFLPDSVVEAAEPGLSLLDDVPAGMLFDLFRRPLLQIMQPLALDDASFRAVTSLLERMHGELEAKAPGYEFVVRGALQMLLVTLARCAPSAATAAATDAPRARDLVGTAFTDIDAHFNEKQTLAAASRRLQLNAGHLTTRLRRLTGRTYGDWVIERRMIEARRLLAGSDLSVAEIAERLGYAESESFIRRFREHHALTPAAWRNAAKSRSIEA